MATEIAQDAATDFIRFFRAHNLARGEDSDTVCNAFLEWLRLAGGYVELACDYHLVIETLLRSIEELSREPGIRLRDSADVYGWDFLSEPGFRWEMFKLGSAASDCLQRS